jgi:hypothetical protein
VDKSSIARNKAGKFTFLKMTQLYL